MSEPQAGWLRARLEGQYVGRPVKEGFAKRYPRARRFDLTLLRARLHKIETLAAEPALQDHVTIGDVLTDVRAVGPVPAALRGQITLRDIFALDLELKHPAAANGRVYGSAYGSIVARYEVVRPAEPDAVPLVQVDSTAPVLSSYIGDDRSSPDLEAMDSGADADAASLPPTGAVQNFAPPLWALALLVAAALFFACGVGEMAFWSLFAFPTLGVRAIVHRAWTVSRTSRVLATLLIGLQWVWILVLTLHVWDRGCVELQLLPVLGLVLGVFLSGFLPRAGTLMLNATLLALVLFSGGTPWLTQCGGIS